MATSQGKDLIFLTLQLLEEGGLKETARTLERELGIFFNMKYFEELVVGGKWEEAEKYLSGFTKLDDNGYSRNMFFEIRKQKYLEALDKLDRAKAVEILTKDLKVFSSSNEELYEEHTQLLTLDNFRDNEQFSKYKDVKTARAILWVELKKLIEFNSVFRDKLQFPDISALRILFSQTLNWLRYLHANPRQNPDMRTLLPDHSRNPTDPYRQLASSNQLIFPAQKMAAIIPMFGPFPPTSTPVQIPVNTWVPNPSIMSHPVASGGAVSLGSSTNPATVAKGHEDSDSMSKARPSAVSDRIILPGMNPSHGNVLEFNMSEMSKELPKTVVRTLNQGSAPISMDFHPIQQTLLLVGTNVGEISLWEVSTKEKLLSRKFEAGDSEECSNALKANSSVSIRRILWGPDGALFGVAYSKHLLRLYIYVGKNDIRKHLEIDSHCGAVNDLAFCNATKQLSVITCGDDKLIKVWDVNTGTILFTFEGHEAPVNSVCPPPCKKKFQFIFSTSMDGKIKAWLYGVKGAKVNYGAPSNSRTTMAYSADGKRLFSCGTAEGGKSHLAEWYPGDSDTKRNYQGLEKSAVGVVQFDITKNGFLAAGDNHSVKFWDMERSRVFTTVDAGGGLPASPRIRFNKEGSLLAVSANDDKIKILATVDGLRLMQTYETRSHIASRSTAKNDSKKLEVIRPKPTEEVSPTNVHKLADVSAPAQFHLLKLPAHRQTDKISRLMYTNSGNGILALAFNAIHLLWKWPQGDLNLSGKATTKVSPHLVQPSSKILMTNDRINGSLDKIIPCFAISKNDCSAISASGGHVSLFNMITFETMATFEAVPPAATCLAFDPQDKNIIAIGKEDSTICIYHIHSDMVESTLKGHSKRITGLAFSRQLNILVSSGADAQIITWELANWKRQKSCCLPTPAGRTSASSSDTQIQFQPDHTLLLAVNEAQLAIYDIEKLECLKQWAIPEASAPISQATLSCDSQLVYGSFLDGTVRIFCASNLQLQCQINPTAYLPSDMTSSIPTYPLAVAAHPQVPNQFAIGLTDGSVYVFEPLESEGKWVPQCVESCSSSLAALSPMESSDQN